MERWMRVPLWSGVATVVAGSVMGGVLMMAPSGTAASGQGDTPRRATPECTNDNLTATYKGSDAAMSHVYGRIVLRNTSDVTCWVRGYGGLSYVVGGAYGNQVVGAAADRTPSNKPKVTLAPGEKVRSAVTETSSAPYPKQKCQPVEVDGFRVYVPDETEWQYIAHPTTGCANRKVHLLEHRAYR
jgi:uncharacterized protein DUF4232